MTTGKTMKIYWYHTVQDYVFLEGDICWGWNVPDNYFVQLCFTDSMDFVCEVSDDQ